MANQEEMKFYMGAILNPLTNFPIASITLDAESTEEATAKMNALLWPGLKVVQVISQEEFEAEEEAEALRLQVEATPSPFTSGRTD
jgi:hypothetical protein